MSSYAVKEVASKLGFTSNSVHYLLNNARFGFFRVGRRIWIPKREIDGYINRIRQTWEK